MALAFYDGRYVDHAQIAVRASDFGFARGVALFDFARCYNGVPFRLMDHLDRLLRGAEYFGIKPPVSREALAEAIYHMAQYNKFPQSGIKIYLTAGECGKQNGFGFLSCEEFSPHIIAIEDVVKPKHPDAPTGLELVKRGLNLKTVPFSREMPVAKVTNYTLGFRAARELAGTEFEEVLFMHRDGFITETTTSNFFCVIDDVLVTPQREMLDGITRKVIFELAEKIGLAVARRDITLADLRMASSAFIASSFVEMLPIGRVDDIVLTQTDQAPVYVKLRKELTGYIAQYCSTHAKAA